MFAMSKDEKAMMNILTKAEEQVMQILWDEEEGFVKDLLQKFPEPKPAYNTVSTIIRILEKKGFVDHRSFGKSHQYYPLVSRDQYRSERFSSLMKNYFNNSIKQALSHFSKNGEMDIKEADDLISMIEDLKKQSDKNE